MSANFVEINDAQIKKIEEIAFSFVWNNKVERVSRLSLCQKVKNGGLNMLCIRSKIHSQQARNFSISIKNCLQDEFQQVAWWFKLDCRKHFKNYNITASVDSDSNIPDIYVAQRRAFQKIKKIYLDMKEISGKVIGDPYELSSKIFYVDFVENYKRRLHIESEIFLRSYRIQDSRMKTLNYKILLDALPLNSYINKNNRKCPMCNSTKETLVHLFIECRKIRYFWVGSPINLDEMECSSAVSKIFRFEGVDKGDITKISDIKHRIWIKRCQTAFKVQTGKDVENAESQIY